MSELTILRLFCIGVWISWGVMGTLAAILIYTEGKKDLEFKQSIEEFFK